MNNDESVDIICKDFCTYYKPGQKEEIRCGTYEFLFKNLSTNELRIALSKANKTPSFKKDTAIRGLVCMKCTFLVEGCDYRDGMGKTPCGGYSIIEGLLRDC